jgi:hypothetical protein
MQQGLSPMYAVLKFRQQSIMKSTLKVMSTCESGLLRSACSTAGETAAFEPGGGASAHV